MTINHLVKKWHSLTYETFLAFAYPRFRVLKDRILSNCKNVYGKTLFNSPVLIKGLRKAFYSGKVVWENAIPIFLIIKNPKFFVVKNYLA